LFNELQSLYPEISALSYSNITEYSLKSDSTGQLTDSTKISTVILTLPNNKLKAGDRSKIEQWLHARLTPQRKLRVVYTSP
jgi:hypothetical protein